MQGIMYSPTGSDRTCQKSHDIMEIAILDFQIKEMLHSLKHMASIVVVLATIGVSLWAARFYFEKDATFKKKKERK